jgi:hypothetical protein
MAIDAGVQVTVVTVLEMPNAVGLLVELDGWVESPP